MEGDTVREAEEEGGRKESKMGQCVWLLKGSPAGRGRGGQDSLVEIPAAH